MMKHLFLTLVIAVAILYTLPCQPIPPIAADGLDGKEIMRRVNARSRGQGIQMHLEMTLLDARRGDFHKSILMRRTRLKSGYRTTYWIDSPDHEKGIALLISEDSSQHGMWMYFPVSRQVLHVVSRGFPALASDFTCEDLMAEIPLEDYEFRVIGKEKVAGTSLVKIEMIPRDERLRSELGFSKSVGWVRDDIWMIVRADYYDDNGELFKSFQAEDIKKIHGVWTVRTFSMQSRRIQHGTRIHMMDVDYSLRLPDTDFVPGKLSTGPGAPPM
jgi:hypothetical protein